MGSSIFKNVKTDRQYSASTGLTKAEFEALYEYFEEYYKPKPLLLIGRSKQSQFQDKREALFFILYYLKTGLSFQVLGLAFNLSDSSAHSYIKRIKPALKASLMALNMMPETLFVSQADFDKAFEGVEDIFIDCTEIPVERSGNQDIQKEFYSGKKNSIPPKS